MIASISTSATFKRLESEGTKLSADSLSFVCVPNDSNQIEIAFAIGRKFGNAVKRNRARRRIKEALRVVVRDQQVIKPVSVLVLASPKIQKLSFEQLVVQVEGIYKRIPQS